MTTHTVIGVQSLLATRQSIKCSLLMWWLPRARTCLLGASLGAPCLVQTDGPLMKEMDTAGIAFPAGMLPGAADSKMEPLLPFGFSQSSLGGPSSSTWEATRMSSHPQTSNASILMPAKRKAAGHPPWHLVSSSESAQGLSTLVRWHVFVLFSAGGREGLGLSEQRRDSALTCWTDAA